MNIIEQIKTMPDEPRALYIVDWHDGTGSDCTGLITTELKALAERLLQLLKTRGNDYTTAEEGEIWTANVKAAIEQAEALSGR